MRGEEEEIERVGGERFVRWSIYSVQIINYRKS